jgi:hypothetical protein
MTMFCILHVLSAFLVIYCLARWRSVYRPNILLLDKNLVMLDWLFDIVLNVFLKRQRDEFYLVKPRE